jgi:hypothetical protein
MQNDPPELMPNWTFWVPGASCFYQKNYLQGTVFADLEIVGV